MSARRSARRIAGWAERIPRVPCQEVAHSQSLHRRGGLGGSGLRLQSKSMFLSWASDSGSGVQAHARLRAQAQTHSARALRLEGWSLVAPQCAWLGSDHKIFVGGSIGKRAELCTLHLSEALAWHSDSVSLHCRWHPDLLALLPACASPQVISCQGVPAYARRSLQTTCLAGVRSSTCSTKLDKFQYTP